MGSRRESVWALVALVRLVDGARAFVGDVLRLVLRSRCAIDDDALNGANGGPVACHDLAYDLVLLTFLLNQIADQYPGRIFMCF